LFLDQTRYLSGKIGFAGHQKQAANVVPAGRDLALCIGPFVSPASARDCNLAFSGGLDGRLACREFYDLRRPSSELDADRSGHYLGLDFPFLAVTAVDASATW
jgi:hypothetical protein